MSVIPASTAIAEVIGILASKTALPACVAGSAVAAETYGLPADNYSDIDVFCYTPEALMVGVERLTSSGQYIVDERHQRVLHRWTKYGMGGWHTNSLKLMSADDTMEVNLIYKCLGRQPLTSLSQVLESFDFGLLGTGYDLELMQRMDMRSFLFPTYDIDGPLPMMPLRRDAWRGGFISQYHGLREMGRYAKYARRGYDMSLVKEDLVEGYMAAATYLKDRTDPEKLMMSKIYYATVDAIEDDRLDELEATALQVTTLDTLDAILEGLE